MEYNEMNVLGLHGGVNTFQHDAAAALICDGKVLACVEEERLSRVKHAYGQIPIYAITEVLKISGLSMGDIDIVCHSGKKHEDLPNRIRHYLEHFFGSCPKIKMLHHQDTHIASSYYMSGFDESMVISFDGFGDWDSIALGTASADGINVIERFDHTASLGVFYQALTSFMGFAASGDEYKVMGLSPYGKPGIDLSKIIHVTDESYFLDSRIWDRDPPARSHFEPRYGPYLKEILGEPRHSNAPMDPHYIDIAYATQNAFENVVLHLVTKLHEKTGLKKLCLAGGCALNCLTNMKITQLPFIDELFIQPASTDQGTALGGAIMGSLDFGEAVLPVEDYYLGGEYKDSDYLNALKLTGTPYTHSDNPAKVAAEMLAVGKIIGWFQGRSEFGPRALGNRSILADPSRPEMKDEVNKRIKYREEFRPFAPAVLAEKAEELFEMVGESPFMTVTFPVRKEWQEKLPAVNHINNTARVQTVSQKNNLKFYDLINHFYELTGIPGVLNTSFNIRGEPVVETPLNAISTFAGTGLDALILGPYIIKKQVNTQ